jgi:TonB family protein
MFLERERCLVMLAMCGLLVGPLTTCQVGDTTVTRTHALENTEVLETSPAGLKQEVAIAKIKSSASNLDASPNKRKEFRTANSPEAESSRGAQEPSGASQNSSPGVAKAAANTESRLIQNIAPEEMWNRVTECLFPQYPQLAMDTHITGTVSIGLGITPQGDVGNNFRVLDGPPLLVQSAIDAILQWKFRPNEVQGEVTWSRVRALARFNSDGTTAIDLAPAILADNFGDPGTPKSVATVFPRPSSSPGCKLVKEPAQAPMFVDGAYVQAIGGIGAPMCVECPDPSYSEEARAAKASGTVVLHLIVTEEGHATNIQVKRPLGHGLDEKAAEAVGNWRFKPALGPENKPVPVWTDVEVNFRIK